MKEQFSALSLDLPTSYPLGAPTPRLSELLAQHLAPETLDKRCEGCQLESGRHTLRHRLRRLPRVLVVHLKRFKFEVSPLLGPICRKLSVGVVPDKTMDLGSCCCPGQAVPQLLLSVMSKEQIAARAAQRAPTAAAVAGILDGREVGVVGAASAGKGSMLKGGLSSQAGGGQKQHQEDGGDAEDDLIIEEEEDKENQCRTSTAGVGTSQTGAAGGLISKQRLGGLVKTGPGSGTKGKSSANPFLRRLGSGAFHGATGTVAKKVRAGQGDDKHWV